MEWIHCREQHSHRGCHVKFENLGALQIKIKILYPEDEGSRFLSNIFTK
jgi:hypothetical protein